MSNEYQEIGPNEPIREGDQFLAPNGIWYPSLREIGASPHPSIQYRRPKINDETLLGKALAENERLKAELASVRTCFAEASQSAGPTAVHVERLKAENAKLLEALRASYSLLSMLPCKEFWNPDDAADFFQGTHGTIMRNKFDAAWTAAGAALAESESSK
jgi:hypothetical protein